MSSAENRDTAALVKLLTTQPLYAAVAIDQIQTNMPPDIQFECEQCEQATTWSLSNVSFADAECALGNGLVVHNYCCNLCRSNYRRFCVLWESRYDDEGELIGKMVSKIGQWPAWERELPAIVRRILSDETIDYYRRGLTNLTTGYGLGALSYLRRVVRQSVGNVLDMLREVAEASGDIDKVHRIESANVLEDPIERLRLVEDWLPESLRGGRANPMQILCDALDEDDDDLREEQAIEAAMRIDGALRYVLSALSTNLELVRQYAQTMGDLSGARLD